MIDFPCEKSLRCCGLENDIWEAHFLAYKQNTIDTKKEKTTCDDIAIHLTFITLDSMAI